MPANPESHHCEHDTCEDVDRAEVDADLVVAAASSPTMGVLVDDLSGFELMQLGMARARETLTVSSPQDLVQAMQAAEGAARQTHSLTIDLLTLSEHTGLHFQDGHRSPQNMMRHVCKLRSGQSTGRAQCHRMFRQLALVAAAYRDGNVGTDQVELLGRVFANKRVCGAMVDRQEWFLQQAERLSFKRFQQRVLNWERLIDEDGLEPAGDRVAQNRKASIFQDPTDLSWDLTANFTSVDGAHNAKVLDAFVTMLFEADWAEAKVRVGDGVCKADLARTDPQRRSDALTMIFATAIAAKEPQSPQNFVHHIVWSASAYEEMARRTAGAKPQPFDVDDYRCETIDGDPLDPVEAFANSMVNKIRRVVVDAQSIVIDAGRARLFTGLLRDAIRVMHSECYWPGCHVPASSCETDHVDDHANGGRTNPGNGGPLCGRHNRWKQKGFKARYNPTGKIQVYRPDGSEIL